MNPIVTLPSPPYVNITQENLQRAKNINEFSQRWKGISILVVVLIFANHFVRKNPRGNYGQCEKCNNYEKWPPSCYIHNLVFRSSKIAHSSIILNKDSEIVLA